MKITKIGIIIGLIEAGLGFVLWTGMLSPYMIFVTRVTTEQYASWLFMQAFIVPPVAVIVVKITNKATKFALRKLR